MEVLILDTAHPHERGVTLVETLVALLILSFVAVSTIFMFSQGMRLNSSGRDYSAITNVAKDKAEQLMGVPYDDPFLTPGTVFTEPRTTPDVTVTWIVAEHNINQATSDIRKLFDGNPLNSTTPVVNTGDLKVIAVTVASGATFGIGRRSVTLQVMKADDRSGP